MKNKSSRSFVSIFLSVILIFSLLPAIPISAVDVTGEVITGTILAENDDIDLSGIEIKLYSSVLINENTDTPEYMNTYIQTISCNADGTFTFTAPSERFRTSIDKTTLPEHTGVNHISVSWENGEPHAQFVVSEIASIELSEYTFFYPSPVIYNANGERLFADFTVSEPSYQMPFMSANNAYSFNSIEVSVSVWANGVTQVITYDVSVDEYNSYGKLDLLYEFGLINEHTRMSGYADLFLIGADTDSATIVSGRMYDYIYNTDISSQNLSPEVQLIRQKVKAIVDEGIERYLPGTLPQSIENDREIYTPNYITEGTATFTAASINVKLHYENNASSPNRISAAQVSAVQTQIISVFDYYFTTYSFTKPNKETSGYYNIYLEHTIDGVSSVLGRTVFGAAGTATRLKFEANSSATSTAFKRTIAHEVMHAITYKYNDHESITDAGMNWFTEGLGDFAGMQFSGDNTSSYVIGHVRTIFNYPSYPLSNVTLTGREYGSCSFFKYIYQNCGGWATIKTMLSRLLNYEGSSEGYNALASGLVTSGYSFADVFAGYTRYNSDPRRYTGVPINTWTTSKTASGVTSTYDGAMRENTNINTTATDDSITLPPNSAVYFDVIATNSSSNISVELENITNSSNLAIGVLKYNGNDSNSAPSRTLGYYNSSSNNTRTIPISNFRNTTSASYVKRATIILANTSYTSQTVSFDINFNMT